MNIRTFLSLTLLACAPLATACDQADNDPALDGSDESAAGKADGVYGPACEPTAEAQTCNVEDGCGAGQYCQWQGQGLDGVCVDAAQLVHDARVALAQTYPGLSISRDGEAVVSRQIKTFDGEVNVDASTYYVDLELGENRQALVRFDVGANYRSAWREVPEDIRASAPWGNAQYIIPGIVSMTMTGDSTLESIHSLLVGPVLDSLSMSRIDKSFDDTMWFFTLETPAFDELEAIQKIDDDSVLEAWPDRIMFLDPNPAPTEIIAEF